MFLKRTVCKVLHFPTVFDPITSFNWTPLVRGTKSKFLKIHAAFTVVGLGTVIDSCCSDFVSEPAVKANETVWSIPVVVVGGT